MNDDLSGSARIAIACGGTGGHLFPGLAVGEQLVKNGCRVTLLVSQKEVDQEAAKSVSSMEVVTLPAVALTGRRVLAFVRGFAKSYRVAKAHFVSNPPQAALAMGGFTSAPPILAAKRRGAKTFLHESNTVPGRANRWLSRLVDAAFVGFPSAAERLHINRIAVTGTPVRPQFKPTDAQKCRVALGLAPDRPTVLVTGGSQGASVLNLIVPQAATMLQKAGCDWQWFHLTGAADMQKVRQAYASTGVKALVHAFLTSMEIALGAATVAVSRAGASFLAECAAMRLPAVLVPYPAAKDDHQYHNARAFELTHAAYLLPQRNLSADALGLQLKTLIENAAERESIQAALTQWHSPDAALKIAEGMLHWGRESNTFPAEEVASCQSAPTKSAQDRTDIVSLMPLQRSSS